MESYNDYAKRIIRDFGKEAVISKERWHLINIEKLKTIEQTRMLNCKENGSCDSCSG